MPNYTILALQGIISTFIGMVVTLLLTSLSQYRLSLFWFVLILAWLLIASINGYIVISKFDPLIFSLFLFLFSFIGLFFFSLLISSFSVVMIEAFQLNVGGVSQLGTIKKALIITIIISIIILVIQIIGSYSIFLIKSYIQRIKPFSVDDVEEQAYKKYDMPSDSGSYSKRLDDFDQ
ncbi:MAG: hypothetical protein FK731_03180 [Asgard group archaeon]|nr:hypothetical protein [Asgard group archaeon]